MTAKILPAGCLVLGLALVAGCRSAPQTVAAVPATASIPPLFGSPVNHSQFALSNEATSPTPLDVPPTPLDVPPAPAVEPAANVTPVSAPTLPPAVVAQPEPMMPVPPSLFPPQPSNVEVPAPVSSGPPVLAQLPSKTPQLLPPSPVAQQSQQWAPTSCLPVTTAETQVQQPLPNDVQSRLLAIEKELNTARDEMKSVNGELRISQSRISDLNNDLTRWKQETKRLEAEMKSQQQSDLKALDELATAVSALIERQKSAQATSTASTQGGVTQ